MALYYTILFQNVEVMCLPTKITHNHKISISEFNFTFLLTVRSVPSTRMRLLSMGKTLSKNCCKAGRSLRVLHKRERRSTSERKNRRGESLRKDQSAVESNP